MRLKPSRESIWNNLSFLTQRPPSAGVPLTTTNKTSFPSQASTGSTFSPAPLVSPDGPPDELVLPDGYTMVNIWAFGKALLKCCLCRVCGSRLKLKETRECRCGFVNRMHIGCSNSNCGHSASFLSLNPEAELDY